MVQHFKSFTELMEVAVLPFHKKHLDWARLDGAEKGGNLSVFATFQYEGRKWRINSDTHLEKLLQAFKLQTTGSKPFTITTTPKGKTTRLLLSNQKTNKPNGLYIYQYSK